MKKYILIIISTPFLVPVGFWLIHKYWLLEWYIMDFIMPWLKDVEFPNGKKDVVDVLAVVGILFSFCFIGFCIESISKLKNKS